MENEQIEIGVSDRRLVVRPIGHVTAKLCQVLKTRLFSQLDAAGVEQIEFDMSACKYMDSTFLGLLLLIEKSARAHGFEPVTMHQTNDVCRSLLSTMGMERKFIFTDTPSGECKRLEILSAPRDVSAQFLLETHRELSQLSPENEEKFRLLTTLLEKSEGNNRHL